METKQEPVDDVCESSQSVDELSQSDNFEADENEVYSLATPNVKQEVREIKKRSKKVFRRKKEKEEEKK